MIAGEWIVRRHRPGGQDDDSIRVDTREQAEAAVHLANTFSSCYPGIKQPYAEIIPPPVAGPPGTVA